MESHWVMSRRPSAGSKLAVVFHNLKGSLLAEEAGPKPGLLPGSMVLRSQPVATTRLFLKRHPEFAALGGEEGYVPCWHGKAGHGHRPGCLLGHVKIGGAPQWGCPYHVLNQGGK